MKLKLSFLLTCAVVLTACGEEKEPEIPPEVLAQVLKTGEAQAVVKLINRAQQNPCQPIYLFNNLDEDNKQEVNLINVNCESLNLPTTDSEPVSDSQTP